MKTLLGNIHRNKARGYYTKLDNMKNSDTQGKKISSMYVDCFHYLLLVGDFLSV